MIKFLETYILKYKVVEDACVATLTAIIMSILFLKDSFLATRGFCIDFCYGNRPDPETIG